MENPTAEAVQETPAASVQEDPQVAESVTQENPQASSAQIIEVLNDIHWLLNMGQYPGEVAHRVISAKQFVIDFKNHLLLAAQKTKKA